MYGFNTKITRAQARVRDSLKPYIDKADAKEEINLKELAKDCTSMIQLLFEENDLPLYCIESGSQRVTGVSFTQSDDGHISINLQSS